MPTWLLVGIVAVVAIIAWVVFHGALVMPS